MYCKKCGKFIGNDSDLCDECIVKEEEVFSEFSDEKTGKDVSPMSYQPSMYNNQTTYVADNEINLGKSIAAIILSNIGFWLIYIGIIVMGELAVYSSSDYGSALAFMIIGCIPSVLGLIFGIQSISYFKSTSMIKSGKRIPVLILGISSVVIAGIGLFLAFIMLMIYGMI